MSSDNICNGSNGTLSNPIGMRLCSHGEAALNAKGPELSIECIGRQATLLVIMQALDGVTSLVFNLCLVGKECLRCMALGLEKVDCPETSGIINKNDEVLVTVSNGLNWHGAMEITMDNGQWDS